MPIRTKKLIGVFLLLALVLLYAVFATAFASAYLGNASGVVHLVYFFVTGLMWVVPAALLIRWMERAPRN